MVSLEGAICGAVELQMLISITKPKSTAPQTTASLIENVLNHFIFLTEYWNFWAGAFATLMYKNALVWC